VHPELIRPAGLYFRDTWRRRLGHVVVALIELCFAALLLGLTIFSVVQVVLFITLGAVTWPLAGYLLVAVAAGAGTFVFGRGFAQETGAAIRRVPEGSTPSFPPGQSRDRRRMGRLRISGAAPS